MSISREIDGLLWADRGFEARDRVRILRRERPDDPEVEEASRKVSEWLAHTASPEAYRAFYAGHRSVYTPLERVQDIHNGIPRLGQIRRWMMESPPTKILDMGCFDGFALLNLCKAFGAAGVGVDIDMSATAHAADLARKLGLECGFVDSLIEDLDIPGRFDAILLMEVLEHVIDPAKALRVAEKHLEAGGRIYITTPGSPVPHMENEHEAREHLRCLSEKDLFELIGDRVIEGHATVKPFDNVERIVCYRKPRTAFVVNQVGGGWDARDKTSYGGSEEGVVGLAEELAKSGHEVAVFRNGWKAPEIFHELNGVHYFNSENLTKLECDVAVIVKWPEFLDADIKARRVYFWTTDPNTGDQLTPLRLGKVDKVVALTEWHKLELLNLNPAIQTYEKIAAIPYGIPYALLHADAPMERNPHTMVYASSYDRGLEILLDNWQTIRNHVPDAELHIWYGWELFDKVTGGQADFSIPGKWKQAMREKMIQTGIYVHPRTTPDDPRPFTQAAIWAYPCIGGERFCLTGIKAQRLGAVPVIIPTMALNETVQWGVKSDINSYIEMLIVTMKDPNVQEEIRKGMIIDPDVALSWERVYREYWRPMWADVFLADATDAKPKIRSQKKQSLSVCMITHNAEAMLIRCLRSVKNIADEIIVADAGSKDRTLEIVEEFGGRIVQTRTPFFCLDCDKQADPQHFVDTEHEPFGFEGPRNDSIHGAQGNWIMWIDSDEELLGQPDLEKYLRKNPFNGYAIKQHHFSAVPPNAFKADMPVRMFRNGMGIRFIGKVHEHPERELNESVTPAIVLSDVDIAHDGYLTEIARRNKFSRNIGLMKSDRRKYPDRTLGKFLWLRDCIHLARYALEASGGRLVPEVLSYAEEAAKIYETEFLGYANMYAVDGLDYYSEANRVRNVGFEAISGIGAAPSGMPQAAPYKLGRFASIDAWLKSLEADARAAVDPFTGKYA